MDMRISTASAVAVHRVPPAAVDWFLGWQRGVVAAAERFPGYRGTDLYPPAAAAGEWVAVLHFADEPALRAWLDSAVRADWLERFEAKAGTFELTELPGGFAPWFAAHRPGTPAPPGWKMALTVVLGLFPTVQLIDLALGGPLRRLGPVPAALVGNLLSVALLQWAVMPTLTRLFRPWLTAEPGRLGRTVGGAALVAGLLAGMVVLFRAVR